MSKARPLKVGKTSLAAQRRIWWLRPRVVRWYLHRVGFLLALVGVIIACGPMYPGEQQYLGAAERLKASLRYDLALARYADASAVAPTDPLPYCLTGDIRALQQEWSAAVTAYSQCVDLGPQQAGSSLKLGNARQALGDTGAAVSAWERAASLGDTQALRQLATAAEQRGDVAGAVRFWQKLPSSDGEALAHLGMLALWEGRAAAAADDFQLAEKSATPAGAQLAAEGFTVLIALPQGTSRAQGELGHAFLAANIPALAERPFERAVHLAPQSGEARAYLGWTFLLLGQPLLARPEIAQGLSLSPSVSFVWFAAGELALALQQPSLAVQDFQRGATLDPKNPLFFAEAGQASLDLRDYTAAEQLMQTASSLSSTPTAAITLLSIYVEFHLGLEDGTARAAGIQAVTRWPHNEPLEFLLAQIFADSNQEVDAYYAIQAAHLLDPTDPGPYVYLGAQAENEGDYVTAALDLHIALALRPDGPFAPEARTLLAPIADVSA